MTTIEYRLSRIDSWSCRKVKLADLAEWLEYYVELGFEVRTAR